jgi:hypothetical protein
LTRFPARSTTSHVGTILLTGEQAPFEAQAFRPNKTHTARRVVLIQRCASSFVKPRVVNGACAILARSQSAISPDKVRGLRPPIGRCVSPPVSRLSLAHLDTQEGLISSAALVVRIGSPASHRANARSRRSSEYGGVNEAAFSASNLESEFKTYGNPGSESWGPALAARA